MDEFHLGTTKTELIFRPPGGSAQLPGGKEVGRAARLASPYRRLTAHHFRLFQTESTQGSLDPFLGGFFRLPLLFPAFSWWVPLLRCESAWELSSRCHFDPFPLFLSAQRVGACVRVQPCCGFLNMMAVQAAAGLSFYLCPLELLPVVPSREALYLPMACLVMSYAVMSTHMFFVVT